MGRNFSKMDLFDRYAPLAYSTFTFLSFIETRIFTSEICSFLSDRQYRLLQEQLLLHPTMGDVIKGSGGLRKLRCSGVGIGKRGGLRIIYYLDSPERIYLLFVYRKNAQEDLTHQQLKQLHTLIK